MIRLVRGPLCITVAITLFIGCGKGGDSPALSKVSIPKFADVPTPAADGPRLGATRKMVPVRREPVKNSDLLGYLRGGSTVARAQKPISRENCEEGWYPVRPKGFVCLEEGATLDMQHPTLEIMAIAPELGEPLPYTYARNQRDTNLYKVSNPDAREVNTVRPLTSKSGAAIIGSFSASGPDFETEQLAMMTTGQFLRTKDLEQAKFSQFHGLELEGDIKLPAGFVVKRGVAAWDIDKLQRLKRKRELSYHDVLNLTGSTRKIHGNKVWETVDGEWVRHRDVSVVRKRSQLPEFVHASRRWIDVSVIMGTAVAYIGSEPVYATLVSVGKDRIGEGLENPAITKRGEFPVVAKAITAVGSDPKNFANRVELHDVPWALELASEQLLHGAYWHNRFGIEHGPGNLQFAPKDARWLWGFATPKVPEGWHAIRSELPETEQTIVNVHR